MIDRRLREEYEKQAPPLTPPLILELQAIRSVLDNPSRTEADEDKAIRDLSPHVENKNPYASGQLIALAEQLRKNGNLAKALYCCEQAVKGGDPQAILGLGIYYAYHLPLANKEEAQEYYKRAVDLLHGLAEKGDVCSIYHLGKVLSVQGLPKQACQWFERGAKIGDVDCMFELGKLLFETIAENQEALVWLEKAASQKQGDSIAYFHQLIINAEKNGKHDEAFKYCKLLANLLEPEALNYLGVCHQVGKGTSVNQNQAETCFKLAASNGSIKAMMNLAEISKNSNRDDYLKWLSKAADCGHNFAKFTLAKETMDIRVLGEFAQMGGQVAVAAYTAALSQADKPPNKLTGLDLNIFSTILRQTLNSNKLSSFRSLIEISETKEIITKDQYEYILNHTWRRALIDDNRELLQLIQSKLAINRSKLFLEAINNRSFQCLNSLLTEKEAPGIEEQLSLAGFAAKRGDLTLTLILCPDKVKAAKLLFEEYLHKNSDEELNLHLLTILRFTAIEKVDELISLFESDNKDMKAKLKAHYQKAKDTFLQTAPYFARLTAQAALLELGRSYKNSEYGDLKVGCKKDMEYGEKRKALTENLYRDLIQTSSSYQPKSSEFLTSLPPSSKGTRRAAALLEKVAAWVFSNQAANNDKEQFSSLRTIGNVTPVGGRYSWALPILKAIHKYSQSTKKDTDGKPGYNLTCFINDEETILNEVSLIEAQHADMYAKAWWYHGRAPLAKTWPFIEDLFEKILSMDSKNTVELYSSMAELVWLIGNTQPMERGSGSFAEVMLAVLHLHHGLKPPVLKVEFPQLDVLDISFPLNDYKKLFAYFFEPSTIPESLRQPSLSSLSMDEQLKVLYENLAPTLSQTANTASSSSSSSSSSSRSGDFFTHKEQSSNAKPASSASDDTAAPTPKAPPGS